MYFATFLVVNLLSYLFLVHAINIYFDFFVTIKFKIPIFLNRGKWPAKYTQFIIHSIPSNRCKFGPTPNLFDVTLRNAFVSNFDNINQHETKVSQTFKEIQGWEEKRFSLANAIGKCAK
jgi:hypothetical protein